MRDKGISKAVIERLPRYYRYLGELMEEGVERISSGELSARMHVTASQIRQDLNHFGGFGQQGYGYNVKNLYQEIAKLLGLHREHHVIIIGAGNLGQALANYGNFENRGFLIDGLFDQDKRLKGTNKKGIPVYMMEELGPFLQKNRVDIAVLAIPKSAAEKVAAELVEHGIRAIWNFAHTDLDLPEDVVVENVHLSESLMQLSYRMAEQNKREA